MDKLLDKIVTELRKKYQCHTVILYGSRARGTFGPSSDYDVMGVRSRGTKLRIAKKKDGHYLDIFIFPEKVLRSVREEHLYMKDAVVLYEKDRFGSRLVSRIQKLAKSKPKPLPNDEILALKVWANKMLERAQTRDLEGNYRRSWLQMALLEDYFLIRRKRFQGSKTSFEWLKKNDPTIYRIFENALAQPDNLKVLKRLVERVIRGGGTK